MLEIFTTVPNDQQLEQMIVFPCHFFFVISLSLSFDYFVARKRLWSRAHTLTHVHREGEREREEERTCIIPVSRWRNDDEEDSRTRSRRLHERVLQARRDRTSSCLSSFASPQFSASVTRRILDVRPTLFFVHVKITFRSPYSQLLIWPFIIAIERTLSLNMTPTADYAHTDLSIPCARSLCTQLLSRAAVSLSAADTHRNREALLNSRETHEPHSSQETHELRQPSTSRLLCD